MNRWTLVANLSDIPHLGARALKTQSEDIALFRTGDDQVFALRDSCPHRGGPLSAGMVHATAVSCPLHNWKIDLESGEVMGPDEGCVHTFPAKVEDGQVFIDLRALESAA